VNNGEGINLHIRSQFCVGVNVRMRMNHFIYILERRPAVIHGGDRHSLPVGALLAIFTQGVLMG
jgi:hypothetical protein